jgi:hypothetical protein
LGSCRELGNQKGWYQQQKTAHAYEVAISMLGYHGLFLQESPRLFAGAALCNGWGGGSGGRHLQEVANQVGQGPPFLICTLLQALMQLPVSCEGDPLWAPAQQVGRARCTRG